MVSGASLSTCKCLKHRARRNVSPEAVIKLPLHLHNNPHRGTKHWVQVSLFPKPGPPGPTGHSLAVFSLEQAAVGGDL